MMDSVTILSLIALLCCTMPAQIASMHTNIQPTPSEKAYSYDVKPLYNYGEPDPVKAPDSRWRTPPDTVQEILQDCPDYYTQLYPFEGGHVIILHFAEYIMQWVKGSDEVIIDAFPSGKIDQEWKFGDSVHIKIKRSRRYEKQVWKMENTKMYYYMDMKSGSKTLRWENDIKDFESLQKYQGFISSWCAENAHWVLPRCNIFTVIGKK